MKAIVDQELCVGCGICTDICPEVFELNDNGKAESIVDPVPADAEDSCKDAADQCPETAIKITQ